MPANSGIINLRSGSIFRFALKITFRRARRNENRSWYKPSTKRLPPTFLIDGHLPNQPTKTTSVACFFGMQIFHTWEKCNFPRFSVHKSLKILENYIAHFFKGYINKPNEFSSAFNVADLVPCVHLQIANLLEKQTSKNIYTFINPGKYCLPRWNGHFQQSVIAVSISLFINCYSHRLLLFEFNSKP